MRFYLVFLFLFILVACSKKDSKPDPTNRDITGTVQVFDEFGVASNDVIGVTVTLSDGTNDLTTQTIQNGKYNFSKVPFGKYNLAVSKNGFGTNKQFGIKNLKKLDSADYPLQLGTIGITQKTSTTITSFSAAGKPNRSFDFWVTLSPAAGPGTTPRYFRIFVGLDSLFDWTNPEVIVSPFPVTGSGQSGNLRGALLPQYFPAGTKAWIRVYADASPNNMYYDSTSTPPYKFFFPCMNLETPPASSFIVQE
jgi:hypothetical protein